MIFSFQVTGYKGNIWDERCRLFVMGELALIDVARRKQETQMFAMYGNGAIELRLIREGIMAGGSPINKDNIYNVIKMYKNIDKTTLKSP